MPRGMELWSAVSLPPHSGPVAVRYAQKYAHSLHRSCTRPYPHLFQFPLRFNTLSKGEQGCKLLIPREALASNQ